MFPCNQVSMFFYDVIYYLNNLSQTTNQYRENLRALVYHELIAPYIPFMNYDCERKANRGRFN